MLVVRNVADCAQVLRRVLTNDLEDNKADRMWYLKERISGSVY